MLNKTQYYRLFWKCRRGALELDLLFQSFLEKQFVKLSQHEIDLLDQMLDESDVDLQQWLVKHITPENSNYIPLIDKIKSNYSNS